MLKYHKYFYFLLVYFTTYNSQLYAADTLSIAPIQQVKFKGADDFPVFAKFYQGNKESGGVLLLHGCDHDSRSFDEIAPLLVKQGINALAIDLRGFGKSIDEIFSHKSIKKQTKNIANYQGELLRLTSYWPEDLVNGYAFLNEKITKSKGIAVISSGCSAPQAVALAEKLRINSFVMVSPVMNYMEKEFYKNLIDIPAYFVSSAHHAETYKTSTELFQWNGTQTSTIQIYKGNRVGHALLRGKPNLAASIVLWLGENLK